MRGILERAVAALLVIAAGSGSACTEREKSTGTQSGGRAFAKDSGQDVVEQIVTSDVDPEEPVELRIAVLRCAQSSDPVNFGFAYYTNGVGRCARGPTEVPLGGELQSTDVDVRLYYECGSIKSDESRPSLQKTGPSRLDGSFTAKAERCAGSGSETFWHMIYERRARTHDLLIVHSATFTDGP
jgi:hypothetical protein